MDLFRRLVLIMVLWPSAMIAQERDVGLLVGFLEEQLSSAGRTIRIDGFSGALSARATLDRMTIADSEGEWLVIENAELDWSRAAVLRGDIQIKTLSAATINVLRRPQTSSAMPTAAAEPFSLPNLPLTISVAAISTPYLRLGPNVVAAGQSALELSLLGSATLAEGSGDFELEIDKLTGAEGQIDAAISFLASNRTLNARLNVNEAENGLLADLLDLPGKPSVALALSGDGTVDDFTANLRLETDNQPRLIGQFQTSVEPTAGTRAILADVSGDLTPLFDPSLQDFFGDKLSLSLDATRTSNGAVEVTALDINAQSITLTGSAKIDADGWPIRLALAGRLADIDSSLVQLPVPGSPVEIAEATVSVSYDRTASDALLAEVQTTGFQSRNASIDRSTLRINGSLSPTARQLAARISIAADGVTLAERGLSQALGSALTTEFSVIAGPDAPILLNDLKIATETFELSGSASARNLFSGIDTSLDLKVQVPDLRRFEGVAGRQISGALSGQLSGAVTLLSGAFDLALDMTAQSPSLDMPQIDALLKGETKLSLDARRDETGLILRELSLNNDHASLEGSGSITETETDLDLTAVITSLDRIVPGFPGAARIGISLKGRNEDQFALTGTATGPGNLDLNINGQVQPDFQQVNLTMQGGGDLSLANPFLSPRSLSGQATTTLTLRGPLALGSLAGRVDLREVRLADPSLPISILNGNGTVVMNGTQVNVNMIADGSDGGSFRILGPVGLTAPNVASLDIAVTDLGIGVGEVLQTSVSGNIEVDGPLTAGGRLSGALLLGSTEVRVATFNAGQSSDLQGLVHIAEPASVRETRAQAGLLEVGRSSSSAVPLVLDIALSAPNQVFIRGRGLDAELGGGLLLRGTTADIQPEGRFPLIRGRLDLLGQRLSLDEGSAVLEGALVPRIRLLAVARSKEQTLNVLIDGSATEPQLTISSDPDMPQDAALAQFLFGRGIGQLSPLQAAQLASALVTLTGDGSGGILDRLRESTGLDDFDIAAGGEGEGPALRAGKYLSENIYSDLTIGADGSSSITLNLDISSSVTVRGAAESEGGTGIGIFFERDY